MMTIKSNPFYILNLECNATRRDISAAVDEMDFIVGSEKCALAQSELTSPNKRLSCEMDWFPDATPTLMNRIRSCIDNNEDIPTASLNGLSKLNGMQYNLSKFRFKTVNDTVSFVKELDKEFSSVQVNRVLTTINTLHQSARIGEVSSLDIERELNRKRDIIRQQLSEIFQSLSPSDYMICVTQLVKECIEPVTVDAGVILYDVVDQYEIWAKSQFEIKENEIIKKIEDVKLKSDGPNFVLTGEIESLITMVNDLHKLSYPIEVIISKSGIDHSNIQSTAFALRELCIYLHNEKDKTDIAFRLVGTLKKTFSSLGTVYQKLSKDEEDLRRIKQQKQEYESEVLANQQADKEYSVTISGEKYAASHRLIVPPFCTCCMQPTQETESLQFLTMKIDMPLCDKCKKHRKQYKRKRTWLVSFCIILGVVASFLAYAGFKSSQVVAFFVGLAISMAFYFIFFLSVKEKALPREHSSRFTSAHFKVETKSYPRAGESKWDIIFFFTNWKYANLFREMNLPMASPVSSMPKENSAKRQSMRGLDDDKNGRIVQIALIFALISVLIINIRYQNTILKDFDLRQYFEDSQKSSYTVENADTVTATPVVLRSTPKVTAKSSATKAPSAVTVKNGQIFVATDYKGVCPFKIVADSFTNYYVYLEYRDSPKNSKEKRLIMSSSKKPYEPNIAFYLKAGQTVEIDVPIGIYKLYYAAGSTFYGTKLLFGDTTQYYSSDELLTFYADSEYYHGTTITLKATYNGNFDTDKIPESQFPTSN